MKILNFLTPVTLLLINAGCQSDKPRSISRTSTTTQTTVLQQNAPPSVVPEEPKPTPIMQFTAGNVTYTIESIPNTRLTPTSREGDNTGHVYSSNIIAVYVHTNNNVTVNSTNAPAIPAPASNPQPQNK